MKQPTQRIIGNTLVLASFVSSLLLFGPLLLTYLPTSEIVVPPTPQADFRIAIPRIHAHAPVIENVDPWDKTAYLKALQRGVAHASSTGLPGSGRTIYLFAHSTGLPWEQLYYNTIFLRLGELQVGDEIILDREKKRYVYRVAQKKEVPPNETSYLENTDEDQLILQTCTPIGTSLKRLLIFAKPVQ